MKILFLILFLFLVFPPLINHARRSESGKVYKDKEGLNENSVLLSDLSEKGLSPEILNLGMCGLKKLELEGRIKNQDILSIADYSQPSFKKRFFVIDLKQKKILFNTYVAHGRNSGEVYATSFSNKDGSLKSSLGFYITGQTTTSYHTGYSLELYGIEAGINDHAFQRAIIMHGADYVSENFIRKYGRLGRSFGCPALPSDLSKTIIDIIKEGSCLFIYNPDPDYLAHSELLAGS